MSARTQRILIWWSLSWMAIFGLAWRFLLHMLPPPSPTWSADRVAEWYVQYGTEIKWGATVAGWTSAFMVPLSIVIAVQMSRLEKGKPIWSILALVGGCMMSIFFTLPPVFWGVAAFTPTRAPEITTVMHELGLLTLVSTDQYYIFLWIAVAVICLIPTAVAHSPFPRWFGYFTIWNALMLEVGAIAFNTRTGPFAWNGLLVFWIALSIYVVWIVMLSVMLFKAIAKQEQDQEKDEPLVPVAI